jgi:hypothetical protein
MISLLKINTPRSIDDGMEDAVLESAPGQFGEEALDGIEP